MKDFLINTILSDNKVPTLSTAEIFKKILDTLSKNQQNPGVQNQVQSQVQNRLSQSHFIPNQPILTNNLILSNLPGKSQNSTTPISPKIPIIEQTVNFGGGFNSNFSVLKLYTFIYTQKVHHFLFRF